MIYSLFFQQLLYGVIALLFTYIVGKIIISFYEFKADYFLKLFVTNVIGITVIVIAYSIIKSQGKTIHLLLLPIVCYFLYFFRKYAQKPVFNLKEIRKDCLWLLGIFVIFFLYQSWFYLDFLKGVIKSIYVDYYVYASASDSLKIWGIENGHTAMDSLFLEYRKGLIPYHYFELWITAFYSQFFSINTLPSYYFITTGLLSSYFLIGIMGFAERATKNNTSIFFISLCSICIGGISFSLFDSIRWLKDSFLFTDRSILTLAGSKFLPILIFALLYLHLWFTNQKSISWLIIICIPILSFIFLPAIYGGLLLFLFLSFLINRFTFTKNQLFIFISTIIILLGISLFYSHFKSEFTNDYAFKEMLKNGVFKGIEISKGLFTINNCKIMICNFFYYSLPIIISYFFSYLVFFSPFIIVSFSFFKKNIELVILLISFTICGALGSVFTKGLLDNLQFVTCLSGIILLFLIVGIIESISTFNTLKQWQQIGIYFIILVSILNSYPIKTSIYSRNNYQNWFNEDKLVIQKISNTIKEPNATILIFLNETDFDCCKINSWFIKNDLLMLNQWNNNSLIFLLGNPEGFQAHNRKINNYELSFLNIFTPINVWREKGKEYTLKSFIETNKITYFYFKNENKIPDYLKNKAEKTIYSSITNAVFLKIKK